MKNGKIHLYIFISDTKSNASIVLVDNDNVKEVYSHIDDYPAGYASYDREIYTFLLEDIKKKTGIDVSNDKVATDRLMEMSEKIRKNFYSGTNMLVDLPFVTADANGPKHYSRELTSTFVDQLTVESKRKVIEMVKELFTDNNTTISITDIEEVTITGEGSNIKSYKEAIMDLVNSHTDTKEVKSDKVWNKTINEDSAIVGMQFLKELCDAYQTALSKEKEKYEDDKKRIYNQNRSNLTAINNRENTSVNELKKANSDAIAAISAREKESYTTYHNDLESFLKNNAPKGFIRKMIEKVLSSQTGVMERDAQTAYQQTQALREQLSTALKAQREQQNLLHQEKIKQANAAAELERSRESVRYNEEMERLQDDFKRTTSEMDQQFRKTLNEVMSDSDIGAYVKMVLSSIPAFEGYTCSTTIPEYVYFGDVTMEVARKTSIHPEVSQMITGEVSRALDATTPGVITAKLPYCQRLDDGISLFLNYSPSERKMYQDQLRMMLLKLFMAFPAGKLEATMIDPLELGETFALFTKLGEEQSRIIDTKIWSQEKDISEAINVLRQKLETMTQAYGNDKVTRLKKEPIRVLAITDFPTGFTQNALRDLQAIVRKSASYGVCVFIWANSEEIAKLQASQQSIFNEIKQMLHVATADSSGSLKLETAKQDNVILHLDSMSKAQDHTHDIISTLTKGIHTSQKKIERFEEMYNGIEDPNNWFAENTIAELAIPIGIKGASQIVKMVVGKTEGSTAHHALIAGQTGAGKSTLLHTIIMSTLLNYSPDEAQLYLIDFKEGVEFKTYSKYNLPSIRLIAIDCEREFGLNILKELQKEMSRRFDLFEREAGCKEISDYRKSTGKKIPKLLLIIDEVQDLFREKSNDGIGSESEIIIAQLLEKGRAAGIHIILASQTFNQMSSVKGTLFAHSAIRIAIKGSPESVNSVLGEGNDGAKQLADNDPGAAIYNENSGIESANMVFQVAFLDKTNRATYLNKLNALQNSEAFAKKYKEKTRILLTNAEDDIFNVFNQLIINKKVTALDEDDTRYCLTIGDGFELKRKFKIGIAPRARQNMLMIGNDEKRAASLFYFSILSLLYGELGNEGVRKDNQLIHLIDLSVEDEYIEPSNTHFKHLESLFPKQLKRVGMRDMDELISVTYDTLIRRMDGEESSDERLFLMFFGINRAHKLVSGNMYEDGDSGEMSTISKLAEIMKHGAKFGINCIVWGENLGATSKVMGENIERDFAQRIVFSTDNATMEQLVMEQNGNALRPTTAVYMNVDDDVKNTHFRPYEIPAKVWVEKIAKTYRDFE